MNTRAALKIMGLAGTKRWVLPLSGLVLLAGFWAGGRVMAQSAPAVQTPATSAESKYPDPYDRGAMFYRYQRVGTSGVERGQEIYYMRCWMCHSEYVHATDPNPPPSLRNVFKSRDAKYVQFMIRNGGARMPAFAPETLSDEEVKDLVAYLSEKCGTFKTGSGCFDEYNPPLNPRYRYPRDIAPTHLGPRSGT